jgi:hypothetical protein
LLISIGKKPSSIDSQKAGCYSCRGYYGTLFLSIFSPSCACLPEV